MNVHISSSKLKCRLTAISDVEHLQQIYTGFSMLHSQGVVDLTQEIPPEYTQNRNEAGRWTDYRFFNTIVTLNGSTRLCYDVHDWNWVDPEILAGVDYYFKRSFDPQYISGMADGSKIMPLGLNYDVASPGLDIFKLRRSAFYSGKNKLKSMIKALALDKLPGSPHVVRLNSVEGKPEPEIEPRVLFMTRSWDTDQVEAKSQCRVIEQMNESRAECIRALRRHFGTRFYGGLLHDDYSQSHFSDCLLPDQASSQRFAFLQILKSYPICVTSVGLNNSNGWKLAEYVAMSKAVVTEPVVYGVPGSFERDQNYLEFTSPETLVEAVGRLFEDRDLRRDLMTNNHNYYHSNVRADVLVLNTLNEVRKRLGEPQLQARR